LWYRCRCVVLNSDQGVISPVIGALSTIPEDLISAASDVDEKSAARVGTNSWTLGERRRQRRVYGPSAAPVPMTLALGLRYFMLPHREVACPGICMALVACPNDLP